MENEDSIIFGSETDSQWVYCKIPKEDLKRLHTQALIGASERSVLWTLNTWCSVSTPEWISGRNVYQIVMLNGVQFRATFIEAYHDKYSKESPLLWEIQII